MKKLLALVLAMVMTLGLATVGTNAALSDFSDASDVTNEEAMAVMNAVGVFVGSDGKLDPKGSLTRAAAAKLVAYLALGEDIAEALPRTGSKFADVPDGAWYTGYVNYMVNEGYTSGTGANTFSPDATLTGYQFGAFLLAVLGYDRNLEGMIGSGWETKVAVKLEELGINKNVDKLGSAALTREEAAQFCLNALKADTVKYADKGTTITVGDANITTGAKTAEPVTQIGENGYNSAIKDETGAAAFVVQLGEKLYKGDLKLNDTTATDNFGRTAKTWTYEKDEIGTYATDDAEFVFTKAVKAADMKTNLKNYTFAAGLKAIHNAEIGDTTIADYAGVANLTANGRTVELYADKKEINKIVVIDTISAEVTAINNTKKTFTVSYAGTNAVIDSDSDFYDLYGKVAEDDILAVCPSFKDGSVLDLYIPEKVEGSVSYVANNKKSLTVAGTSYSTYAEATTMFDATWLGDDVAVYLTKTGYIFYIDQVESSDAEYIFVTNYWQAEQGKYGAAGKFYVKGVLTDGTIVEWEVANETGKTAGNDFGAYASYGLASTVKYNTTEGSVAIIDPDALDAAAGALYAYTKKSDGKAVYVLTVPVAADAAPSGYGDKEGVKVVDGTADNTAFKKTASKLASIYTSGNVSFVYVTGEGDDLKATVGGKNDIGETPSYIAVVEEVDDKNVVTVVYVLSATVATDDTILVAKVNGSVKYKDAKGDEQTGKEVLVYTKNATETTKMIVDDAEKGKFYTSEVDGDGYKLTAADTFKVEGTAITSMYNGYATVGGTEFNLNDVAIVDYSDNGIGTTKALENAVNADDQAVTVSFLYNGNDSNKVETVYVLSVESTDTGLASVTVNGQAATIESSETAEHALSISKDTALTVVVETEDDEADVTITYRNDDGDYGTFTNGTSKTKDADNKTGYFKIVVEAESGATATYYVAFKTPVGT